MRISVKQLMSRHMLGGGRAAGFGAHQDLALREVQDAGGRG
jgi:hypothetical protein